MMYRSLKKPPITAVKKERDNNMKLPKAITFDTYGTLIDWEGEIALYFQRLLAQKGVTGIVPHDMQRRWEVIQFEYIQECYRPYTQVLHDTMLMTGREFGVDFTEEEANSFAASMGSWRAFDDVKQWIPELRKLTKAVLLTNTDNAIIAQSVKLMGVEFDDIITAEMAGCYKPHTNGFLLARQRLGLEISEIMHAGFGFKYDVEPAFKMGYQTCWINRQGEPRPSDIKETYMVGDLRTLVYMLKGMESY